MNTNQFFVFNYSKNKVKFEILLVEFSFLVKPSINCQLYSQFFTITVKMYLLLFSPTESVYG